MTVRPGLVLGLDFGGTKLAAGLIDVDSATLLGTGQCSTRPEEGPDYALSAMLDLATSLEGVDRASSVGISFGGHVRDQRILRSLHVDGWADYPLQQRVHAHFGQKSVAIENDATATALAEWRFGAGRGAHSMLYVTVSTGVGAGLVVDGKIVAGDNRLAGEIGHTKLMVTGGPVCSCGQRGCVEALASGPAIVETVRARLEQSPERYSRLRGVSDISARTVAQLARDGDRLASTVLGHAARYCGIAIANAVNLLDVDRVVVGGGVSRSGNLWWNALERSVESAVLPWRPPVQLRSAELGPYEGVWGAAAIAPLERPRSLARTANDRT